MLRTATQVFSFIVLMVFVIRIEGYQRFVREHYDWGLWAHFGILLVCFWIFQRVTDPLLNRIPGMKKE